MQQDIILLIIGGLIAILSSVVTLIVTKMIDRYGKLKIYKKIVYSKDNSGKTWGCFNGAEGLFFQIPLWIEIQNTSNSAHVVRNLNACLYRDNKEVALMTQINKINDNILANDGAYSFIVEPRSIKKYDCHFTIKKREILGDCDFDEVKITYYDFNDTQHIMHLKGVNLQESWNMKRNQPDKEWSLLKS